MSCAWLLLLAGLAGAQDSAAPLASGLVRSLELEPPQGTWVQHFRLDADGRPPGTRPLALLRYVAGPDPAGGVHADLELHYLADDVRVIHIEQASTAQRRIVFREVRARAGRTLFLEGTPERGFEGYELGGSEVVRRALEGGEFPLLLIESARLGLALPAEAAVLDPLAGAFEPVKLLTEGSADERVFEARRADGSLRWRASARGPELTELRFQERGPVARAVDREEYERLRAAHADETQAAREAAAAAARAERAAELARRPRPFQTGYR